jgi:hypothetical protein
MVAVVAPWVMRMKRYWINDAEELLFLVAGNSIDVVIQTPEESSGGERGYFRANRLRHPPPVLADLVE